MVSLPGERPRVHGHLTRQATPTVARPLPGREARHVALPLDLCEAPVERRCGSGCLRTTRRLEACRAVAELRPLAYPSVAYSSASNAAAERRSISRADADFRVTPIRTTALKSAGMHAANIHALQVVRRQSCTFSDARQHLWTNLVRSMESEDKVGPAIALQDSVGATTFALDRPADTKQRRKKLTCLNGRPVHPCTANTPSISGMSSPCSRRSARTRNASALAFATASSRFAPYTRTPGNSGTSPIQRPSVSRSISTVKSLIAPSSYNGADA